MYRVKLNFIQSAFMNRLLSLLFCMVIFVTAKAQSSYTEAMQQGDDAFKNSQYKTAINKYFAAEAFDPSKKDSVKARLNRIFDAIENLRNKAEEDKTRAEKAENLANDQKIMTEAALAEAKKQTSEARKEQQKLQRLNEFMKYNKWQVFGVIEMDDSLILDLKLKEYNLSVKYDSAINSSYKFYSFYDLSNYYSNSKKFNEALNWADSLCRQYPDSALSFNQRSIVNYYRADWQQALNDLDTSLKLNPTPYELPLLKWNKGLILSNLSRYKEARDCIMESANLLKERTYTENWGDYVISGEIDTFTNMKSIYMELKEQIDAMKIYATVNDIYTGSAPLNNLENMANKNFPASILLSIINYTNTHLRARPADYIGYLVNGFFWELANEPKLAEKNYSIFFKAYQKAPNKKYMQYKNNFSSPIYNKLKK